MLSNPPVRVLVLVAALTLAPALQQAVSAQGASLTIAASHGGPYCVGGAVTWTATASGGTAPHSFQWWLYDGTWKLLRDWHPTPTLELIPTVTHPSATFEVRVRSAGTGGYEGTQVRTFPICAQQPMTLSVASGTTGAVTGATKTWTATSAGGFAHHSYKWWVYDGVWRLAQDWSLSSTLNWTPTMTHPNATLDVRVRSATNGTDSHEALTTQVFAITAGPTTLSLPTISGQQVGVPVTWTATSAGGSAPHSYKWWVYDGVWTVIQDWSTSSSVTWTPTTAHPNATLDVRVRSVGNTTENHEALVARTFAIEPQSCTYQVSPTSLSVGSGGSDQIIQVTTQVGCTWTATESSEFVSIESGGSSTGSGAVTVRVTANTTSGSRTATVTVAGQTVTITQGNCTYQITPPSIGAGTNAATHTIVVTAPGGCGWTATSQSPNVSIQAGSGVGSGEVTYSVTANLSGSSRSSELSIGSQTHTITQVANEPSFITGFASYRDSVCGFFWHMVRPTGCDGACYVWEYLCYSRSPDDSWQPPPLPTSTPTVYIAEASVQPNKIRVVLSPINGGHGNQTLRLQLRTQAGQFVTIFEGLLGAGEHELTFPFESIPDGTYNQLIASWVPAPLQATRAITLRAPICSDGENGEKTRIVRDFDDRGITPRPACSEFTETVPSLSHYSLGQARQFSTWNTSNSVGSWALLTDQMVSNVFCIVNNFGSVPILTSGYRPPADQIRVNSGTRTWNEARHVYGDAADLSAPDTPAGDAIWQRLRDIAKSGACGFACVEPRDFSPKHFHAGYGYPGGCKPGW